MERQHGAVRLRAVFSDPARKPAFEPWVFSSTRFSHRGAGGGPPRNQSGATLTSVHFDPSGFRNKENGRCPLNTPAATPQKDRYVQLSP